MGSIRGLSNSFLTQAKLAPVTAPEPEQPAPEKPATVSDTPQPEPSTQKTAQPPAGLSTLEQIKWRGKVAHAAPEAASAQAPESGRTDTPASPSPAQVSDAPLADTLTSLPADVGETPPAEASETPTPTTRTEANTTPPVSQPLSDAGLDVLL